MMNFVLRGISSIVGILKESKGRDVKSVMK